MADIRQIFWRAVTPADFFNVERSRQAAPKGGGGQSYFSISFAGLTHEQLGRFLGVSPPSRIGTDRPKMVLATVGVIDNPEVVAPLEFASRYRPPKPDDRYRIVRQNRQYQKRHPAWTAERGFPQAPDDVVRGDPRMPDLTYLKLYVTRIDDGTYRAGYFNTPVPPAQMPQYDQLNVLFAPFQERQSAGLIEFGPGELALEAWVAAVSPDILGLPPEVIDAIESTRIAAGKRPRGQGFRVDPAVRRAVELHAMAAAKELLEADGWIVEDVSATKPYDFDCQRSEESLHVEVKGTISEGTVVLLTRGEVEHARDPGMVTALIVVSRINVSFDEAGRATCSDGVPEVVNPWTIDAQGELVPTGFEYRRS